MILGMKIKKYSKSRLFKLVFTSGLATLAILFSVLSATNAVVSKDIEASIYIGIASLIISAIYLTMIAFGNKKHRTRHIIILSALYFIMAIVGSLIFLNYYLYAIYGIILGVAIIASAVFQIIEDHKFRSIIFNGLKTIFGISLIVIFFLAFTLPKGELSILFVFVGLILASISFGFVIVILFSGMRRTTIMEILRKTYAIEIIYGLLVLIVATALLLTVVEDNMVKFGDALWYCFALVTTIGFGDITATTFVGRILSVILGIYGIVVVALITSIIVNFYNESKGQEDNKVMKENIKKIEEKNKDKDEDESH